MGERVGAAHPGLRPCESSLRRNLYRLTPDALAFAIFYSKVHNRVLQPLLATVEAPHAPLQLRAALHIIDHHIDGRLAAARLPTVTA